jgi:hypothetical protein
MRSSGIEHTKAEHIAATGPENSGTDETAMIEKFLHSPANPLVEASVSVTLMLYEPAGNPL